MVTVASDGVGDGARVVLWEGGGGEEGLEGATEGPAVVATGLAPASGVVGAEVG